MELETRVLGFLEILTTVLETGTRMAEGNTLKAAKQNPAHGLYIKFYV